MHCTSTLHIIAIAIIAQNGVKSMTVETVWCSLTSHRRQANVSRLINKRCQEWGNQSPSRPLRTMDYFIRRRIRGEGEGELWLWRAKYGSDGQTWTIGWENPCIHTSVCLLLTWQQHFWVVYPNGIYVLRQMPSVIFLYEPRTIIKFIPYIEVWFWFVWSTLFLSFPCCGWKLA